jgi:hypothetical protein
MRRLARRAPPLVLAFAALALNGCSAGEHQTPTSLRLQRADLIAVYDALTKIEPEVRREVQASKRAWPYVLGGVPSHLGAPARATIAAAERQAGSLALPALFQERGSAELTGPASGLAGELRSFELLASRGWKLIDAAIEASEHGSPTAARFALANAALYVECVYDAHFTLAQMGKQVRKGWEKLEGAPAFGSSLTLAEVEALAAVYSEPNFRLYPHATVKLGS